jgi:hypothetical protein
MRIAILSMSSLALLPRPLWYPARVPGNFPIDTNTALDEAVALIRRCAQPRAIEEMIQCLKDPMRQ